MKQGITRFFRYARSRHEVYLRRKNGDARPWTSDPILQKYRFTNVFRELDKTTRWFADHVREPLRDKPEVLLATVLFRLLNRIEVGEAIFLHDSLLEESSAFYELVRAGSDKKKVRTALCSVKNAITAFVGDRGPYVTGAYIISSPPGKAKLDGVLSVVENFVLISEWKNVAISVAGNNNAILEDMWEWLRGFKYFGPFHAYEIVTDLRFTTLLDQAPDIMTWANPGPGTRRGLNRVHGRNVRDHTTDRGGMILEMQELLAYSKNNICWPNDVIDTKKLWKYDHQWPTWEMRDVEHTLCEFDKMERVRLGEGRPRGIYR